MKLIPTENQKQIEKIRKETKTKLEALGIGPFLIEESYHGRIFLSNQQSVEVNREKLITYLQQENTEMFVDFKKLELYQELLKLEYKAASTKIFLVCRAGDESIEINIKPQKRVKSNQKEEQKIEDILRKMGYGERVETIQLKKIFSIEEAETEKQLFYDEIESEIKKIKNKIIKKVEHPIRKILSETGTRIRLYNDKIDKVGKRV